MISKFLFCSLALHLALRARLAHAADPPTSVSLSVPDYVVSKLGDWDRVRIPGGELLRVEEGRPEIPYCVKVLDYPKGYRVQGVTMKARSDVKTDSGLNLPAVNLDTIDFDRGTLKEGVYPKEDYGWKLLDNDDGTSTLVITAYPFYYDPKTTKVTFHRNYQFDIYYVKTTVGISSVRTDTPVYDPGQNVRIRLNLENTGRPQEVEVMATAYTMFTEERVAEVPAKTITKLGKTDSVTLEWSTAGCATGYYTVEIVAKDPDGNELDRDRVSFRLGNPQGEVIDFMVEPKHFEIGDEIGLRLEFKNTGTCDLAGECVFRIMKAGKLVDELRQEMALLKPGASRTFQDSWDTKKAEKGAVYYAIGFVRYEGTASEPKSAMFSTNLMPTASFTFSPAEPTVDQEIDFDASASTDEDGKVVEYHWEFDDGGEAADSVTTHAFHQPGDYNVQLKVTDSEGGTATVVQTISIPEE